jgi:hypothetical protein
LEKIVRDKNTLAYSSTVDGGKRFYAIDNLSSEAVEVDQSMGGVTLVLNKLETAYI